MIRKIFLVFRNLNIINFFDFICYYFFMSIGNSVFYVLINFYNDVMRRYFYVYFVDIELFKKLKF